MLMAEWVRGYLAGLVGQVLLSENRFEGDKSASPGTHSD